MAETVLSILLTLCSFSPSRSSVGRFSRGRPGRAMDDHAHAGGSDRSHHRATAACDPPVGMLDLSFIVAIILIQVLKRLLRQALL